MKQSQKITPIMVTSDSVEAPKSVAALMYLKWLQKYFVSNETHCEHLSLMLALVEANIVNEEAEVSSRYERALKVQPTLESFFSRRVERKTQLEDMTSSYPCTIHAERIFSCACWCKAFSPY
jgi:hypothetical protein